MVCGAGFAGFVAFGFVRFAGAKDTRIRGFVAFAWARIHGFGGGRFAAWIHTKIRGADSRRIH